jgi:autotransporter-associated beta strand protein
VDGNYTINSLSFTGTDSAVGNTPAANAGITLAAGTATQPLVITGSNSFADTNGKNYAKGIGLVVQVGSAAHTISTSIDLGNSQTWEIDGSNPLTVSGVIGDGTTLDSLTKTGAGTLILANNNTYDGGTIVTAGTVALGITNALEPTVALTVNGAGTFDLAGFNQTLSTLSDGGVTSGTITSSTGSATLTLENASPLSFGGSITDDNGSNGSSLALALIGPSSVKLSGSSSYTGGTTVTSGTLIASSNHALGSSSSPTGGLLLNPSTTGTATVDFTSGAPSIAALASSVTGTTSFANVVLGNSSTDAQTTLTVGGGGAATNFYGAISDKPGAVATAIGNLVVSGGSLTLNGTDTFGGTTVISGGSLILGAGRQHGELQHRRRDAQLRHPDGGYPGWPGGE